MTPRARNTLVLMSDEHSRKMLGAYGNTQVLTPNLDSLAARGTVFQNAYCNSPICVPSRASFHTGYYPHQIRYWDNAMPYDGRVSSWGHALRAADRPVVSIGKLHFRDRACDTGFDDQIVPLHVKDGLGDPSTLLRRNPPPRPGTRQLSAMTGQGETPYWDYDCAVAQEAERWLESHREDSGWTLFVSFVLPHFPLNAPARFRDLYDAAALPFPPRNAGYVPENASTAAMRALLDFQDHFRDDDQVREAVAHYYALCSALDENVGRVLKALADSGAEDRTTVIYASDHGDNVGSRGYWGKSTLWEESVGVPMILAGPGVPEGRVNPTPVSLVDLYPTITDLAGAKADAPRPGTSLVNLAQTNQPDRPVFAEYHAVGSSTGMFMLRLGRWKLIHCVGDAPLLYDLDSDPDEHRNLAGSSDPLHVDALRACRAALGQIVDPEAANARAFADQADLIDRLGGEAKIRDFVPLAFTDPREQREIA